MKMRKLKALVGIGTLILGWWFSHTAWAVNPITTTDQALTIAQIVGAFIRVGHLFRPANDVVGPANNIWIGWQSQLECNNSQGFKSEAPGALGPCLPDTVYPPFGVGFQVLTGMTDNECAFKAGISSHAVNNTAVFALEGGPPPIQGYPYTGVSFYVSAAKRVAGGICSNGGTHTFEGYLGLAGFYINPNVWAQRLPPGQGLSDVQCAYMVNLCSGPCSCGSYTHDE